MNMEKGADIDFVVLWVDGSDAEWLKEKRQYDPEVADAGSCNARYRDWDTFQYWFRGVEKFAPWVNNIYFVTWGHTPQWLNLNHPKLKIINHKDFIPAEYLPTYNSNAIELNLHRIPDLSEHFVLFNDDTFLLKLVRPEDFFVDGKPCDEFVMNAIVPYPTAPIIGHTSINNVGVINKYFCKRRALKEMRSKIYNYKYGKGVLRNILLSFWTEYTGFFNTHIPLSHLKSTFALLWKKEETLLNDTCRNRFRTYKDLSHWLMRYWNLCSGNFVPRKNGFGRLFTAGKNHTEMIEYIQKQKGKTICVNDTAAEFDFEKTVSDVKKAFDSILPEKSSFEV